MRTILAFQITKRFNKKGARKELKRLHRKAKESDLSAIQVTTFLALVRAEATGIKAVHKLILSFSKLGDAATITAKLLDASFEVFQNAMDGVQFTLPSGAIITGYGEILT